MQCMLIVLLALNFSVKYCWWASMKKVQRGVLTSLCRQCPFKLSRLQPIDLLILTINKTFVHRKKVLPNTSFVDAYFCQLFQERCINYYCKEKMKMKTNNIFFLTNKYTYVGMYVVNVWRWSVNLLGRSFE